MAAKKKQKSTQTAERRLSRAASKTRFVCGNCGQTAWAKSTAKIACGICSGYDACDMERAPA